MSVSKGSSEFLCMQAKGELNEVPIKFVFANALIELFEKIIESMGYVKQERYKGLLQVIKHLENRINDLEKEHKSD